MNNQFICGIDEAGRGPIAGPIVIAGVILKKTIIGLDDSKKLTPKKREFFYEEIKKNSSYHIEIIEANIIDKIGLSEVYFNALNNILKKLEAKIYIFDGNTTYGVFGINPIIKADSLYPEVSAASILAKVTRDKIMIELSDKYPQYQFDKHKGYCTKAHLQAIKKFGYSPIHRKSFKIKI